MASTPLCALVVGHPKKSSGARNQASKRSECDFNDDLARALDDLDGLAGAYARAIEAILA